VNRALRAAAMGVLLLSPVALSACSAGQVAQTAEQNRDRVGGMADAGDIAIRQARLAYPVNGEYQPGSDARLLAAITNGGRTDDTLVSITGPDFTGVEVTGPATPTTPGAPATAVPATGPGVVNIPVPAESSVYVGGDGPVVTLTGLSRAFAPGQALDVTMTFERAGAVPVQVLVGTSTRDLPRGTAFDFTEHGEGGGSGGSGE
jgi:copper(I)-binding protein